MITDYLWAAGLAVVILAMVLLTLLAFPHFALFVIPVAIALLAPLVLILGPVLLLASLPLFLIGEFTPAGRQRRANARKLRELFRGQREDIADMQQVQDSDLPVLEKTRRIQELSEAGRWRHAAIRELSAKPH